MTAQTPTTDEKDLLRRLREGDEVAFADIFDHYNEFLFIQAHKLTRDEDDARDIVQDIFVNVWANRARLDIKVPLVVYLSKSVRFGFFKKLRSLAMQTKYEADLAAFVKQGQCTTDEALLEWELIERLKNLAGLMPKKTGQAFILKNLEQYSIEEIAETLGVSPKTVSNMLSRANKDAKLKLGMGILMGILLS